MTSTRSPVVGVFDEPRKADRAISELRKAGFADDQIGVALRHVERSPATGDDAYTTFESAPAADTTEHRAPAGEGTQAGEGAVAGILTGLGLGALTGLGVLAGVIPVIGPAIAAGTLGVIISNAAAGAGIVGLVGALIGAGVPEHEAQFYQSEFEAGRTIVTVNAGSRADDAIAILRRNGAYDMSTHGAVV